MRQARAMAVVAVATVGALLAVPAPVSPVAAAGTFVVNRIGDAGDINLANTRCDSSTNTGDQCTLRAAIQEANDTPGVDTITFNISGTGNKVIAPNSPLPPITQPMTINGYTQGNASQNTKEIGNNAVLRIVLDGINAGVDAHGLRLEGSDITVRGLVIQRFDGYGIELSGGDHLIAGNFIGTTASGKAARGNTIGVHVSGIQNVIGGPFPADRNLISGNGAYGVQITGEGTRETRVQGNYIGTNRGGTARVANGSHGLILLDGTDNTIGGTTPGQRNVIAGNNDDGVKLLNAGPGNVVSGNYVGTNAAGTAAIGNRNYGIVVDSSINPTIGGTAAGAGNLVSGNGFAGVEVLHGDGATVQGNRIGTRADGTGDLGNGRDGVFILAPDVIVGGAGGAANLISGNGQNGVFVQYSVNLGNQVLGNVIRLNDLSGVHVMSDETTVGGNVIFQNGKDGVFVSLHSQRTRITGNQVFANAELAIDLEGGTENAAGVTSNDTDDPDTGANNRQNFPVLTSATRSNANGITTVGGSLNSNPSTQFTIELFVVLSVDASGHGEGQIPWATQSVTTNSGGDAGFVFQVAGLAPGQVLSATATSTTAGNSSEFSQNRTVVTGP